MNSPPTSRPHLKGVLCSPAVDGWFATRVPGQLLLPRNPGIK